jgi:hypothetical protein
MVCMPHARRRRSRPAAYTELWNNRTGGSVPVPQGTIQAIILAVSFGLSWLILKISPDDDS